MAAAVAVQTANVDIDGEKVDTVHGVVPAGLDDLYAGRYKVPLFKSTEVGSWQR